MKKFILIPFIVILLAACNNDTNCYCGWCFNTETQITQKDSNSLQLNVDGVLVEGDCGGGGLVEMPMEPSKYAEKRYKSRMASYIIGHWQEQNVVVVEKDVILSKLNQQKDSIWHLCYAYNSYEECSDVVIPTSLLHHKHYYIEDQTVTKHFIVAEKPETGTTGIEIKSNRQDHSNIVLYKKGGINREQQKLLLRSFNDIRFF